MDSADSGWGEAERQLTEQGTVEVSVLSRGRLPVLPGALDLGPDPGAAGWHRLRLGSPADLEILSSAVDAIRVVPLSDGSAPTDPSIEIAGGNSWTRTASVTLSLSAADDVGVDSMCISKTSTCTAWTSYTTSKVYSLGSTQGTNTLNVWFRDASGNVSAMATDSIGLDTVKPTDGSATVTASEGQVLLTWTGFQDAGSGIANYTVVYSTTTAPISCTAGAVAYSGPDSSFTHTGLTDGTKYYYRICTTDEAGNSSVGIKVDGRPAPEYNAPTSGTVEINSGATWTKSKLVTLALSAADDTEVSSMCISNSSTCTSWVSYATTKTFSISGTGERTLSVWFRDVYGNVSTTPATDSIIVDTAKPTGGTVTATGSAATMDLAWTGFVDGGSGVASYLVMRATGTRAPTCSASTAIYAGTDLSYSDTGLTDGTTYAWRVCAVDNAGNISTGVSTTGRPAPEYTAPVGTVLIDADNTYAGKTSVVLSLGGTDASGISQMCISNTTSCKAWITFSATKNWTLNGKTGTRTVYASFKDIYGNASTAVNDTILMDTTAPSGGTAAGTTGSGASIDLSYSGFTDAESGVASYKVVYAAGTTAPTSCSTGTVGYSGISVNPAITGLTANTTYAFRVCAVDAVGNVSTGVTTTAATAAEADPPSDTSLLINDGDATSAVEQVLLNLSAPDATGVALMCIGEDPDICTDWESYATERAWTFDAVEGEVSLYAWFEDDLGNRTTEPADATILLDWSAPVDGTLSAEQTDDVSATLEWSDFTDDISGVESYRLVYEEGTVAPESCQDGILAYSGADSSVTLDGLSNLTTYSFRICAYDVAGNISEGVTASVFLEDTTAPVGISMEIEGGATATGSSTVSLSVEATDGAAVTEMCISTDPAACVDWIPYSATTTGELEAVEGERSLYAWFRDAAGNTSVDAVTDSILLDTTIPEDGTASFTPDDTTVFVEWSDFVDSSSGVENYYVAYTEGSTAPADCDAGELAFYGPDLSATIEGLTNGTLYSFRVCAEDGAGNLSEGVTGTARPAPEFDAPTGSISIRGGATYAGTGANTVQVSASDVSGVSQMCLSLDPASCSSWIPYDTTTSVTFPGASGTVTVYAWFEDIYYNRSTVAVSDSATMDLTAPTGGSATATVLGDTSISLSWSGFSDSESGMSSYKVVYAQSGTAPADCSSGTLAYSGGVPSTVLTGLTGARQYSARICGVDAAGNVSAGVTASGTTTDTTGPVGTLSINAGAVATKTTATTLTISATDASTITQMCVSNTSTCTTFTTYSASKSWTLATGAGVKTVYVYLKDNLGNRSAAITDTIIYDATIPVTGTMTAASTVVGQTALTWTGFSDAGSGIAYYNIFAKTGTTAPTTCASGTPIYTGTATSYTYATVTNTVYSYRACAVDNAGNNSTGATKTNIKSK